MKNTNTRAFKELMFNYLADSVDDDEGVLHTQRDHAQRIKDRFASEFDQGYIKQRLPNEQDRIAEWLSGLALHIEYTNQDIVDKCEEWHECTLTDKQCDKVIDGWWRFMAMQVLKMWRFHKITTANLDWYGVATDPDEDDILEEFERDIAPLVVAHYGEDDEPAMNEAFCNWIDGLQKEGRISCTMCDTITRD